MSHSYRYSVSMPAITMEDDLGIVYLVESESQFWSELEDILTLPFLPSQPIPTLNQLDLTLRRSLSLCATYHEQYLSSLPYQMHSACDLILSSELFQFHSDRMLGMILDEAKENTNPHWVYVALHVLLCYGRRKKDFFRVNACWEPLLPFLMDNIILEIDEDDDRTDSATNVPVPIEAKLRSLSVELLYDMCRVQKWSVQDLKVFSDSFLDHLFDLVEQTRLVQDDTFNYAVIKLIVALNEQFMVASLAAGGETGNRVLLVLMRRLGSSKTFGENMIFMLNRAQRTPEDLCTTLLVLKLLYLLFTTKGTEEYFYTNDLCVLVDVFLRELAELDELEGEHDGESLRHTYLRVLHPLLTKTQLRSLPDPTLYKRSHVISLLKKLINPNRRVRGEANPTTKRLAERCLSGLGVDFAKESLTEVGPASRINATRSHLGISSSNDSIAGPGTFDARTLKSSKSMEFKPPKHRHGSGDSTISAPAGHYPRSPLFDNVVGRRGSNASQVSATSLHGVAAASPPFSPENDTHHALAPPIKVFSPSSLPPPRPPKPSRRKDSGTSSYSSQSAFSTHSAPANVELGFVERGLGERLSGMTLTASPEPSPTRRDFGISGSSSSSASSSSEETYSQPQMKSTRRSAPPPPTQYLAQSLPPPTQAQTQTKRRKPPAIPVGYPPAHSPRSPSPGNGVTFTTIKSSNGTVMVSSPLAGSHR
ncbi:hypothetical protein GYMLUDRAFT_41504 [Collybiopsis luxurians FD-317 M1]|uniref:SPIN90/Ldb17 leucine-rich domain-containing protein n=1 Tax=Collybiopsis luxurians FD-317 M1 TaxID=944289 RepID=A0A0D0CJZ9_9AGAR|nr:hypothetical protein GYMLUDRAFT_41504 [Collybiopsis luxurians FD-317 M1]